MRRITPKKRIWLDRKVLRDQQHQNWAAGVRRHRKVDTTITLQTVVLSVPATLTAESQEHRAKILDLIRQMASSLEAGNVRIKLDFSRVEKLFPGGMLVLLATLELLLEWYPGRLAARCPPHSLAGQLLRHFNLADALGVSPAFSKPTHESVVEWRYLTGTQATGAEVKQLLDEYRSACDADIPPELFSVLTEGLTNVRHHAYPEDEEDNLPPKFRRWWLFARYIAPKGTTAGNLYIAIYDIGVGIPATMRTKMERGEVVLNFIEKTAEWLEQTPGNRLDQALLRAAVEHQRSQTGQAHRGRGLPEMREFIETTPGARLYIVSGKAQYSFVRDRGDGYTNGFDRQFPGTLLLWSLPLKAKEEPK